MSLVFIFLYHLVRNSLHIDDFLRGSGKIHLVAQSRTNGHVLGFFLVFSVPPSTDKFPRHTRCGNKSAPHRQRFLVGGGSGSGGRRTEGFSFRQFSLSSRFTLKRSRVQLAPFSSYSGHAHLIQRHFSSSLFGMSRHSEAVINLPTPCHPDSCNNVSKSFSPRFLELCSHILR
ncbi:hypothetical protein BT69DRAFT_884867 [Atractiella rhizophila]|nr:hypothetical protein BT69DRAFT_884867 [Atractiella rhizophila]